MKRSPWTTIAKAAGQNRPTRPHRQLPRLPAQAGWGGWSKGMGVQNMHAEAQRQMGSCLPYSSSAPFFFFAEVKSGVHYIAYSLTTHTLSPFHLSRRITRAHALHPPFYLADIPHPSGHFSLPSSNHLSSKPRAISLPSTHALTPFIPPFTLVGAIDTESARPLLPFPSSNQTRASSSPGGPYLYQKQWATPRAAKTSPWASAPRK